jgi:uncharacterized membrane protein
LKEEKKEKKMNKSLLSMVITLVIVFAVVAIGIYFIDPNLQFPMEQATVPKRFFFVALGLLIAFGVYYTTRENPAWEVGTRQVVWMAIGAALYAVFSWLFNGTVFFVPSISQVALRPAIAIPMFFGYAFGPVVGFFTGAVGNMFGDAITGFGLSPQWSIGNGLIGFISGLWMLFRNRRQSLNTILWAGGALAAITVLLFLMNRDVINALYFEDTQPVSLFAGLTILIGFALILAVRYLFANNEAIATAVTWAMLGNIVGLLFASLSDIFINGLSLPATIVGQFLPAAGPNLIFAAILVPLLVGAYASVQRQSGR